MTIAFGNLTSACKRSLFINADGKAIAIVAKYKTNKKTDASSHSLLIKKAAKTNKGNTINKKALGSTKLLAMAKLK